MVLRYSESRCELWGCVVLCSVLLVRRQGVPVPRWQLGSLRARVGNLVVTDEYQPDLGRYSRIADLFSEQECTRIHRLFDVVLLGTQGTWLTLSGLEREERGGSYADHAQTWHVTPILKATSPAK